MPLRVAMHVRAGAVKLVFAAGVAFTFLLAGATPARSTSQTLRVTTRLVVVNVVAHNKRGEPVTGLTRADFTVLDDGKPQQISVFSVQSHETVQKSVVPLPPNVFSNRVARDGSVPVNAVVILLDGKDTSFADSVFARNAVIKFIRRMPPGENIALYITGRWGLTVIQDFNSDPSPLLRAIRSYRGYAAEDSTASGTAVNLGTPPANDKDPAARILADMKETRPTDLAGGFRAIDTYKIIEAVAGHLSGLPGRKSLVWVTDNVPFPMSVSLLNLSDSSNIDELWLAKREAIQALNQADVAVYPVDAHGLVVGPLNKGLYRPGLPPPLWGGEIWTLAMDYWAKQTGGRAYYYTNGLSQAIRRAVDDSKVTYTLGYYPKGVVWNGKYRHIKIRLDRKGVQLRYRRGYIANAEITGAYGDPVSLLKAVAGSSFDSTGLGLTVRLTPIGKPPSSDLKAAVYVDGRGLAFQPEHGRYDVSFMVWAGQYSKQGALLEAKTSNASFKLTEANYHSALSGGLGLTIRETLMPQAWQLGVAVLDTASGTTGSVRIPLHQAGLR